MAKGLTLPVILVVRQFGGRVFRRFAKDVGHAQNVTNRLAKKLGTTTGVLNGLMQGMAVAVAAAGAALFSAANAAGKFEQSIQAAAFATEAADDKLQTLRNRALGVDLALRGVGATAAAKALREIGAEGLSANEAMKVLGPSIDLARASFFELSPEKAGGLLVQTMRIFNIEANQAALTVDKLTRASTVSAIRLEKLNLFMGIAATGAEAFGASLTDTLSAAALIRGIIPRVERGSTALRGLFDDLADATRRQKLETELGVKAVDAQTGEFRNLFDIVMDVQRATKGMTNAQREAKLQNVFQIEAIAGLRAIMVAMEKGYKTANGEILKGADALRFLRAEIENSEGATKDLVERQVKTFAGGLQALAAGFENFKVGLGDALSFLAPIMNFLGGALAWVGKSLSNLDPLTKSVLGVFLVGVVVAGAIATAILGIGLAVGTLQGAMLVAGPTATLFFTAITTGIKQVWLALGPVGVAVWAIITLLQVLWVLWSMWSGSKPPELPQVAKVPSGVFAGQTAAIDTGATSSAITTVSRPAPLGPSSTIGRPGQGDLGELLAVNKQIRDHLADGKSVFLDGEKVGELQEARRARVAARQFQRPVSRL